MPEASEKLDSCVRPPSSKYMMKWTVGMPAETHLSIAAMILGGAFDDLPRNLKIMFAHGEAR
jgi:aminocarboxymuconate-semialdehyde decarboxylase